MATPLHRRVVGAVFGVLLLALGLSACSSPNSTVVTVGDNAITVDDLDNALETAYADPIVGESVKDLGDSYRTAFLSQLMQYEVIQQIAADQDIEFTDADIDEYINERLAGETIESVQQQYAMQGQYYTKEHVKMLLTQTYVESAVGEKASGTTLEEMTAQAKSELEAQAASTPGILDSWSLLFVSVTDPAQGQTWTDEINSGAKTIEEVGAEAGPNVDGTPQPSTTSLTGEDASGAGFLDQMAPLETGQAGLLGLMDQSTGTMTYVLVYVTERTPGDIDAEAQSQAEQTFNDQGSSAVAKAANDIDIDVNPRYGSLERPEEGLPSIGADGPSTFTEPATSSPSGAEDLTGVTG